MEGLLNKAKKIRQGLKAAPGQTSEDQSDIKRQIEQAVAQSKIQVTPELFAFKARRRGAALPLLVNVGTALVLVAGIALCAFLFSRQQVQQEANRGVLRSAEGKVIAELKKQLDAQMAAKDKEIADINRQMGDLARQRDQLSSTMATAISQREAQLRRELQSELDQERQRLRSLGLDEAEVNRRMKIFEKKKTEEFNVKLAQVRQQAEAERRKADEDLRRQEAAFTRTLTKANQDRAELASDAKRREEELRRSLLAEVNKANSIASQAAQAGQAQVAEAERRLQKLSQQREQEKAVADQITGFYATLRDQLGQSELGKARETVRLLKSYLSSPPVGGLESLAQRRETEMYATDALASLIDKASQPSAAGAVSASPAPASPPPGPSLDPDVVAAALKQAQERHQAELAKALAEVEALKKQLAAQNDGETQAALKRQAENLTGQIDDLKRQLVAIQALADANAARADENAKRAASAEADLKAAAQQDSADLLASKRALELQVDSLQKQIDKQAQDLALAGAGLDLAKNNLGAASSERDNYRQQLAKAAKDLADLRRDAAQYKQTADLYNALNASWSDFLKGDAAPRDPRQGKGPDQSARKQQFNTFVAGDSFKKVLPGFYEKMTAFDAALVQSGKNDALPALSDTLYRLSTISDKQERRKRIQAELDKAGSDNQKEFFQNLLNLLSLEN